MGNHEYYGNVSAFPYGFIQRHSNAINVSTGVLVFLFCFLAFKNISYPLLWNDESETAMTAKQILRFGYPKVHDGKNTVFIADNPLWLGYKPSSDANVTIPWGNYYFATIGVALSRHVNDLFLKTALVRIPFVAAGLLGIFIFAFAFRGFFSGPGSFRLFLGMFVLFELLSVNLLLHIREARYYSLVILVTACYFYVFVAYHFLEKFPFMKYLWGMTGVLIAACGINIVTYFSMCTAAFVYGAYDLVQQQGTAGKPLSFRSSVKALLISALPMLLSFIFILPFLLFTGALKTSASANIYYHNSPVRFLENFGLMWVILFMYEVLPLVIVIKIIRNKLFYASKKSKEIELPEIKKLKAVSFFLALFFITYMVFTARMPFMFIRYFIVLQPVLVLILLADIAIIGVRMGILRGQKVSIGNGYSFLIAAGILCILNLAFIGCNFKSYLYQISHDYHGPLDYYIPAIKERYDHPENLVLATNYEELSYMYYLDCKVILGYKDQFRKLNEDSLKQFQPDIIITRKKQPLDTASYQYYLTHNKYHRISFPVKDWPVNNIADLQSYTKHQFKTPEPDSEADRADIYFKAVE